MKDERLKTNNEIKYTKQEERTTDSEKVHPNYLTQKKKKKKKSECKSELTEEVVVGSSETLSTSLKEEKKD